MFQAAGTVLANDSLEDWRRWHERRQGWLRHLRVRLASDAGARLSVHASTDIDKGRPVIVALDSASPSQRASLLRPAEILMQRGIPVAVVAPEAVEPQLRTRGLSPAGNIGVQGWDVTGLPPPLSVLSAGHYLTAGWVGWKLSVAHEIPYLVVQHGVLTPHAPPPPAHAHLLVWNSKDGGFWSSGRREIATTVVGSQGLWEAAQVRVVVDPQAPLHFLGQLHGAELPRAVTLRTVQALRTEGNFVYRPHPGERATGEVVSGTVSGSVRG